VGRWQALAAWDLWLDSKRSKSGASIQIMKSTEGSNEIAEAENAAAPDGSDSEGSRGGAQSDEDDA
jgi:hypothetical protein